MDWQIRLIFVFLFISDNYKGNLQFYAQRMSNNSSPIFTDEEVITIFLWGIMSHRTNIKNIIGVRDYSTTLETKGDYMIEYLNRQQIYLNKSSNHHARY